MEYLRNCMWIAAGGASGAVTRYLIFVTISFLGWHSVFATLSVNIVGSFLLGLCYHFLPDTNPRLQLLIMTGFMGAFTTFSTFSSDLIELMNTKSFVIASTYAMGSIVLGVAAYLLGLYLVKVSF